MLFGKKNKKMMPEQKQKNIDEFGTNNHEEIMKMLKVLDRRNYKTRCNNIHLIFGKTDNHSHIVFVHTLACRHRIIARERKAFKITDDKLCPTEEMLISLDKRILDNQLVNAQYNMDKRKIIIYNIINNYKTTRYDLYSNNIDDYTIKKDLTVSLKPAKERYQNALKAYEEETQKLLNNTKAEEKTM